MPDSVGVDRLLELLWRAAERAADPDCARDWRAKARAVVRKYSLVAPR